MVDPYVDGDISGLALVDLYEDGDNIDSYENGDKTVHLWLIHMKMVIITVQLWLIHMKMGIITVQLWLIHIRRW